MNDVKLRSGEAVEPLDGEHGIIQNADGYRFGADAVALAEFACADLSDGQSVFDLCSGCGIVGILIAIEKKVRVAGAEIDEALCDMSNRSAAMNGLNAEFYNADVRTLDFGGIGRMDAVVCNPPFFKADSKPRKIAPTANSELTVTFRDIASAAGKLLKQGGEFFLVHTASRLDEILRTCGEYKLTPKKLVINANCKTFLLRAVKGGGAGLTVEVKEW